MPRPLQKTVDHHTRTAPETCARLQRSEGTLRVSFRRRGSVTEIGDLYQAGCSKMRLPRVAPGAWREAVMINTAGGLTDGDRLDCRIDWRAGAAAMVTSQAAERLYRSRGEPARITTRLAAAAEAIALWLPQESILFDGGRLERRTEIEADPSARLVACESVVFGRTAMGEAVRSGAVVDTWRIRQGGDLIFADTFRLSGDMADVLRRPAVGAGACALASVLYVGADAAEQVDVLRRARRAKTSWKAASSRLGTVAVTRILAQRGEDLRKGVAATLAALLGTLPKAAGTNGLPRIWSF